MSAAAADEGEKREESDLLDVREPDVLAVSIMVHVEREAVGVGIQEESKL